MNFYEILVKGLYTKNEAAPMLKYLVVRRLIYSYHLVNASTLASVAATKFSSVSSI